MREEKTSLNSKSNHFKPNSGLKYSVVGQSMYNIIKNVDTERELYARKYTILE